MPARSREHAAPGRPQAVAVANRPAITLTLLLALAAAAQSAETDPATTPPKSGPDAKPEAAEASKVAFFESKIRPLLVSQCYNCHSAETNARGGLRVDDRNGLVQGGNSGPAVVPGNPDDSLLLVAIQHEEGAPRMPPKSKLTDEQVADLTRWIQDGAAWPADRAAASVSTEKGKSNAKYEKLRKEHWAWQPLKAVAPPAVKDAAWPRSDVDRFLLAALESKALKPVADADRVTLLRRVSFDLTGLPPTPEAIDNFLNDSSPNAYENAVDQLLGSAAFGERWGRHWLDVARYGESTGSSRNLPMPHAWRYRDYVIASFQKDKPFDVFIREQIAGDLLPAKDDAQKREQTVATGFLALGVKDVNQRFKVRYVMDNVDEQIDAVSRAVLGLTASCARCHDHKFDPIPQADYYALAGIFTSTDLCAGLRNKMGGGGLDYYDTNLLISLGNDAKGGKSNAADREAEVKKAQKAVAEAKAAFETLRDSADGAKIGPDGRPLRAAARQKWTRLQGELLKLTDPAALGPVAFGVRESKAVADTAIRIRGEAERLGPVVPRGFLSVVNVPNAPKIDPKRSGRLELAQWLTRPENPLISRVIVNRAWQHLFGEGLVRTVDNFGVTGDTPSNPELLDHLASGFVRDGWSIKKLVRRVVLTRAYQLSSESTPAHLTADPSNRLVWRHAPRRLDAEEIRDATLLAAGTLDPRAPEASPAKDLKVIEIRNNGPEARNFQAFAAASRHRSVYLPLLRGITPLSLEAFDFAEQGMVTGRRDTTTVAPQALYFLNDPFVRKQALTLAETLVARSDLDEDTRIDLAYRRTLGRKPGRDEVERARSFVNAFAAEAREAIDWKAPAEVKAVAVAEKPKPKAQAKAKAQGKGQAAPAVPVNPDEVDQGDEPVQEEVVRAPDPQTAAWAALAQALIGSAEFRYLR